MLQTERELLQARIEGNKSSLNRLLADNYLSWDSLTKQDVIKNLKPMPNTSFDTSGLKAHLQGDSANVTGVLLRKITGFGDTYWQVVDKLIKHSGGWQSVSMQRKMLPIWEGKLFKDSEMTLLSPLSCDQRPRQKSLNSEQPAMLKFTNAMSQLVIPPTILDFTEYY